MIADMPSANSAKMLDIVIEDDLKKEYKGLLALLAELGTMPVNLMEYIIKNNSVYGRVLNRIKMFTVCNTVGTAGEYLRLNAVIRDDVLRTGFNMTEDIRKFLNKNTEETLDGFIFSLFSMIDGESGSNDFHHLIIKDKGTVLNNDNYLHELWVRYCEEENKK